MFSMRPQSDAIEGGVVVIGLGRFGRAMADELMASGVEVLGIDKDDDTVQSMQGRLTQVVRADASNEEVLRQLGVDEFPNAVVAIGADLASSILVASALLKLEGPEIWTKASTEQQGEIFTQMGIRHVFHPEKDMGIRAAHLLTRTLSDYFDLGHGFAMATTTAPLTLVGRALRDLNVRGKLGITVIGVREPDGTWTSAHPDTVIDEGQTVLIAGPTKKLDIAFRH